MFGEYRLAEFFTNDRNKSNQWKRKICAGNRIEAKLKSGKFHVRFLLPINDDVNAEQVRARSLSVCLS
jgi:hypothetical protein